MSSSGHRSLAALSGRVDDDADDGGPAGGDGGEEAGGGGEIICSPADQSIRIHRWKVREGFQVTRNHIILLYYTVDSSTAPAAGVNDAEAAAAAKKAAGDLKRLKVAQTGVVRKRLYKDGDIVPMG